MYWEYKRTGAVDVLIVLGDVEVLVEVVEIDGCGCGWSFTRLVLLVFTLSKRPMTSPDGGWFARILDSLSPAGLCRFVPCGAGGNERGRESVFLNE